MNKLLVCSSKFIVKGLVAFLLLILLLTTNSELITVYAQSAVLSLSPSTGTFNKGCTFALEVKLNTGGAQTDGTDAILLYDASRLTASSITPNTSVYPDFPGNSIDDQSGKIIISGIASISGSFSGNATMATVNFAVKDNATVGATQVRFDFDPNDRAKTTDSNVVERGTVADILTSVVNGSYTVGSGTCTTTGTDTGSGGGISKGGIGGVDDSTPSATEIPMKVLPPAGSEQLTFTLAIVGSVLTVLGILGLALL